MVHTGRAEELAAAGQLLEAARFIDSDPSPTADEQILRLQVEALTGDISRAISGARALLTGRLNTASRVDCLLCLGRSLCVRGDTSEGVHLLRLGMSLAEKLGDKRREARALAVLVETLLHWCGPEHAVPQLDRLKRLILGAGDPYAAVEFHLLAAEVAIKQQDEAGTTSHLRSARGLLDRFPNLVQESRLALLAANEAALASSLVEAIAYTEQALAAGLRSGLRSVLVPSLNNLAHLKLSSGDTRGCADHLSRLKAVMRAGGGAELCALDSEFQLALACDDTQRASDLADSIQGLSSRLEDGRSYYGLWYALTRVRWLIRIGRASDAAILARDALPHVSQMADLNLLQRMQLLAAEGLALTGFGDEAARLMAGAVVGVRGPALDVLAETARVAGRLVSVGSPRAAVTHFARAGRIFATIGHRTAHSETAAQADSAFAASGVQAPEVSAWLDPRHLPPVPGPLAPLRAIMAGPEEPEQTAAQAVESVAALMDLAGHPPLLGRELIDLISNTGAASAAVLVEQADKTGWRPVVWTHTASARLAEAVTRDQDSVVLPLGTYRGREHALMVRACSAPAARLTLLAVERLLRASTAAHGARVRERQQAALWPEPRQETQIGMVYAAQSMVDLLTLSRRVANSNVIVLISGETGTGKELLARAVHEASPRRGKTFLPFNCAAVPRDMLDSQLFGYRRGAFTGAHEAFAGVIRAAAGGTLFLDEIGEVGLDVQPKLLRFLESSEIHPLGEPRPHTVDVRIVAATNAPLEQLVTDGRFREDLYYRLNVVPLRVPPLRERREEIPLLVEHFLEQSASDEQKPGLRIAEETMEYLVLYQWPGNVRQLANEIRRMAALAEPGAVLMPEHLSPAIAATRRTIPAAQRDLADTEVVVRMDQPLGAAADHLERAMIEHAMTLTGSRVEDAARVLGLSRKGLYLKRQRLGLA